MSRAVSNFILRWLIFWSFSSIMRFKSSILTCCSSCLFDSSFSFRKLPFFWSTSNSKELYSDSIHNSLSALIACSRVLGCALRSELPFPRAFITTGRLSSLTNLIVCSRDWTVDVLPSYVLLGWAAQSVFSVDRKTRRTSPYSGCLCAYEITRSVFSKFILP